MSRQGELLVLVPHEPSRDPRIHYTAESLAKERRVTVLATVQDSERRPGGGESATATYESVRIRYQSQGALEMCRAYLRIWLGQLLGDSTAGHLAASVASPLVLGVLGLLALMVIALGAVFELALLPAVILREPRLFFLRTGLLGLRNVGRKMGELIRRGGYAVSKTAKANGGQQKGAATKTVQQVISDFVTGIHGTLSVMRFDLSVNSLLWRYATEKGLRADVVYCHDLYTLQAGVMLKHLWGAKLVYDSHEYYPYQYQYWCFAPLIRQYEATLVQEVDAYITVSPQLAAELGRVYGVERVHAIPNVEPNPVRRPRREESWMSELAHGRLKLLYQGAFTEGRGLEEVISDWRFVDGAKIALFLRGPRNFVLDQLEAQAHQQGLLGRTIYILPPVPEEDLIGAAQEADIGLIPYKSDWVSYRFACPNKLSQYLHAGLAILSNKIEYVEQTIAEGNVGLCYDVRKNGSFTQAVSRLSEDREGLETLKRNALAFAGSEFNWSRFEHRLLALVNEA